MRQQGVWALYANLARGRKNVSWKRGRGLGRCDNDWMLVRCLRWFFEYFARDQCQRTDERRSVSATAKVNKRDNCGATLSLVAVGAPAFDLIERRLFGFKNVNQIHLIRPSPDPSLGFIFYALSLRAAPSGFLPLSGNYRALDTWPTCLWQIYMGNRIRILILIRIRIRQLIL